MSNAQLSTTPEHVAHADALLSALDQCFVAGFSRLGGEHRQSLESLGRVFSGTPLEAPVAAAVTALGRSEVTEDHLVALACARESLSGARHDALAAQAVSALGDAVALDVAAAATTAATADNTPGLPGEALTYMSSARQWLVEIALAGFGQLENQTVMPFATTLEAMQAVPALFGLSALLTGFLDELMDNLPTAAMSAVPARRWSDLYTRALIGAWRPKPASASASASASVSVSGSLRVLGADIRHHDHVISVAAYGLFDTAGGQGTRMVRATLSAWKVDAVAGHEMWTAFAGTAGGQALLSALAERKTLEVKDARLSEHGDLSLSATGGLTLGSAFDPMDAAAQALAPGAKLRVPSLAPLDRHPAHLAVPAFVAEAKFSKVEGALCVDIGGAAVPLAWQRVSPIAGLDAAVVHKARQIFGLLRYDGGAWGLQPLLAKDKKSFFGPGPDMLKGLKLKRTASTLGTLQERAGKLLRAK